MKKSKNEKKIGKMLAWIAVVLIVLIGLLFLSVFIYEYNNKITNNLFENFYKFSKAESYDTSNDIMNEKEKLKAEGFNFDVEFSMNDYIERGYSPAEQKGTREVFVADLDGNFMFAVTKGKVYENQNFNFINFLNEIEIVETYLDADDKNVVTSVAYKFLYNNKVYYLAHHKLFSVDGYLVDIVNESDYEGESSEKAMLIIFQLIFTVMFFMGVVISIIFYLRIKKDRANREKIESEYGKLKKWDELTGLANTDEFNAELEKKLSYSIEKRFIVVKIDLMNFRVINEIYGFEKGDQILVDVAEYLGGLMSDEGMVAKGNKDEFWAFDTYENMEHLYYNIISIEENLRVICKVYGDVRLAFRAGVYKTRPTDTNIKVVIENTSFAHHYGRKVNRKFNVYDEAIKERVINDNMISNYQEFALDNKEFIVYLQPKYELRNDTIVGAEALVRWRQKDGTLLAPLMFLPLFEENGFIKTLDMYMLEEVCKIIRNWMDEDITPVCVSVNFSRLHLSNKKFVDDIIAIVEKYDVPKKYIELELTETAVMESETRLVELLEEVHEKGLTMAVDDFGSGYSSLGTLRKLKFDVIKLDKSFLWDVENEERSKRIIRSMIDLSKSLDSIVVAEGVERKEDIDFLKEIDCDVVQGFYFAKPVEHKEFTDLLREK